MLHIITTVSSNSGQYYYFFYSWILCSAVARVSRITSYSSLLAVHVREQDVLNFIVLPFPKYMRGSTEVWCVLESAARVYSHV